MWSQMKRKLESFICDSLKDRVSYFMTMYRGVHDQEGRACIIVDEKEVLNCCETAWAVSCGKKVGELKASPEYENKYDSPYLAWTEACDIVREKDVYRTLEFMKAAAFYLDKSIEECLRSKDNLVLVMALMDRRTGKRTLVKLRDDILNRGSVVEYFYRLRCEAEGMI